jgi:hypothetical protein
MTLILVLAAVSAVGGPAVGQPRPGATQGVCVAGQPDAVTVVVDFKQLGGGSQAYCVTGLTKSSTGLDAIVAAGLIPAGTTHDGPGFVCRLGGRPGPSEAIPVPGTGNYTEACVDTPPSDAHWTYWQANAGGTWALSPTGAGNRRATLGGFEGWAFHIGPGQAGPPGMAPNPAPSPAPTLPPQGGAKPPAKVGQGNPGDGATGNTDGLGAGSVADGDTGPGGGASAADGKGVHVGAGAASQGAAPPTAAGASMSGESLSGSPAGSKAGPATGDASGTIGGRIPGRPTATTAANAATRGTGGLFGTVAGAVGAAALATLVGTAAVVRFLRRLTLTRTTSRPVSGRDGPTGN